MWLRARVMACSAGRLLRALTGISVSALSSNQRWRREDSPSKLLSGTREMRFASRRLVEGKEDGEGSVHRRLQIKFLDALGLESQAPNSTLHSQVPLIMYPTFSSSHIPTPQFLIFVAFLFIIPTAPLRFNVEAIAHL